MKSVRAGIALGSNLGHRLETLQKAREQVLAIRGAHPPFLQSAIYETSPVNCELNAGRFYNAVLEIGFGGTPELLLNKLQGIEQRLGRPSRHPPNSSRTIDLDLLYFGELQLHRRELQLPHPRLAEREFVLRPLIDLNPDLRLPGKIATVSELLASLNQGETANRVVEKW